MIVMVKRLEPKESGADSYGVAMVYTRLGLLGDIHGEAHCLKAALEFFVAVSVDGTLCVGDQDITAF